MHPILRNILAVIVGWIVGSLVNMSLINLGHKLFPIEGVDTNNMEALAEVMPSLSPEYFIFPFLAHALGTLIGAFITALLAKTHVLKLALVVGGIFFIGGIIASVMIPAPLWFIVLDLVLAYFPMAWIGRQLAPGRKE